MSRFFSLLFVTLSLVSSQIAFGAPSCSSGMNDCISKCKHQYGWPVASGSSLPPATSTPSYVPPPVLYDGTSYSSLPTTTPTLSPTPTPTPTPSTPSTPSNSSGNGLVSADDIATYLSAHNQVRAQHGAVDLTWSDDLSTTAQNWANGCVFKHSGGPDGENLAAGTGNYSITDAVGDWAAEVSQYDPNNPVPSHFTQIVWKSTTQVGCAVQTCSGIFDASYGPAQYYVCEYNPPGNVIGKFPENVQV
ncbi:CAP domain-containing protein [Lactarius quietus]|nr:CAP domain-containing protein [Lactarius quietus]